MIVSIIVAASENNVIGKDNQLIWKLSSDLQYFKKTTTGHTILMGRKTFDSIGRALPNRTNIVISRNENYTAEGCIKAQSIDQALILVPANESEVFITGGGEIYKQALDKGLVEKIYLTKVKTIIDGDTFFPEINNSEWKLISEEEHTADEKNQFDFSFQVWIRK